MHVLGGLEGQEAATIDQLAKTGEIRARVLRALHSLALTDTEDYARFRWATMQLEKCAEMGDPLASAVLGRAILNGVVGAQEDAYRVLNQAYKQGVVGVAFDIAQCLFEGIGVRKDARRGEQFIGVAARQGVPWAIRALASIRDSQGQLEEAVSLYTKAALKHDQSSMYELYFILLDSRYGEPNVEQAISWLRMAAEGGQALAQLALGCELWRRYNDSNEAKLWLKESAAAGIGAAHFELAVLFKLEDASYAIIMHHLECAAALGHRDARQVLSELRGGQQGIDQLSHTAMDRLVKGAKSVERALKPIVKVIKTIKRLG